MKTSSHKSVFNLKEAAAYLGISVPTLVRLLGAEPFLIAVWGSGGSSRGLRWMIG